MTSTPARVAILPWTENRSDSMQSSVAVGESPSVGSAHSWVEPVKDPAGPSIRKKLVLKGLPVTDVVHGRVAEVAGRRAGAVHFRNGADFAASVWSNDPVRRQRRRCPRWC